MTEPIWWSASVPESDAEYKLMYTPERRLSVQELRSEYKSARSRRHSTEMRAKVQEKTGVAAGPRRRWVCARAERA